MAGSVMIAHLLLEHLWRTPLTRVPEPHLVMDTPTQVQAFTAIGSDEGLLVPNHFYHALQMSRLIRPGETFLELACGPATQLIRLAQLNPQSQFIGLDASAGMLEVAREKRANSAVSNVKFITSDMADLSGFADASLDCVACTMSLHHLPDLAALDKVFSEIQRILKPEGALYLTDFSRLKRKSTQNFFAYDRRTEQSEQFTEDYAQSLAAAFSVAELKNAMRLFKRPVQYYPTIPAPFMVIFKTPDRAQLNEDSRQLALEMYSHLTSTQQRDFQNIARWYRLVGLALPFELG